MSGVPAENNWQKLLPVLFHFTLISVLHFITPRTDLFSDNFLKSPADKIMIFTADLPGLA
ncbi:hypothetical protein A7K99_06975 [Tatumella citrea]|uniref:Uncharacterized protein n=1 Tax=Tatumella citrea TaxID=53336 RepID=A0A1Y0LHM3_TATCI|nr:hypothetical protein A7K98_06975 [Tatumella citrea]ARU97584.1 hypothetical protein A7K99_06975 [Tatumella citrea]